MALVPTLESTLHVLYVYTHVHVHVTATQQGHVSSQLLSIFFWCGFVQCVMCGFIMQVCAHVRV